MTIRISAVSGISDGGRCRCLLMRLRNLGFRAGLPTVGSCTERLVTRSNKSHATHLQPGVERWFSASTVQRPR